MKGKGTGKGKKSIVRCIIEKMRGGWDAKTSSDKQRVGFGGGGGAVVRWCQGNCKNNKRQCRSGDVPT